MKSDGILQLINMYIEKLMKMQERTKNTHSLGKGTVKKVSYRNAP